jgi:type IV secretion system protein TrbG
MPSLRLGFPFVACSVALASACTPAARVPPAEFIRASPIIEHTPPSVESLAATSEDDSSVFDSDVEESEAPAPPPTSPAPVAPSPQPLPRAPGALIAQANHLASRAPDETGFVNAVTPYAYETGALYKIITAPFHVTDVALEPGEQLLGPIMGGDPVRWLVETSSGAVDGVAQTHVFIKPTRPGLSTNITLTTDRRTYLLDVESLEDVFMVAVEWTYPPRATSTALVPPPSDAPTPPSAVPADLADLRFDYAIEVVQGRPAWKPRAVYDDGVKTFIRFDPSLLTGEAPVLYVIERGESQIVNYRVKGTLYIVDRLFTQAELRLGKDDPDVVLIRRRGAPPASGADRKGATAPRPARFPVKPAPQP